MATRARGMFDVKLAVQTPASGEEATIARMTIDKQFRGDLEGTSKGQMLAAGTDAQGSAGYVALERVTGVLQGRSGSFVLQHSATMDRGTPTLSIAVVPDSGTGDLAGLTGTMIITVEAGQHAYDFDYAIASAPDIQPAP